MTQNAQETPVSMIEGDRLCTGCSYNLRGQTVVREPHYGLFIARCPECGTPAALQEYPLLGRWPGRIKVFVSLAYAVTCLFALFVTFMILMGMTAALSESTNDDLANTIAQQWADYVNAEEAEGNTPLKNMPLYNQALRDQTTNKLVPYIWNYVDRDWWERTGTSQSLMSHIKHIASEMRGVIVLMGISLFLGGTVWAVLLLAARPRVIYVFALLPAGFVLTFLFSGTLDSNGVNGWDTASGLAQSDAFLAGTIVVLTTWLVCGGLGIQFGRPLARLAARALLPPTMRGPLAELWFTDGKRLPPSTRAPRTLYPETQKAGQV